MELLNGTKLSDIFLLDTIKSLGSGLKGGKSFIKISLTISLDRLSLVCRNLSHRSFSFDLVLFFFSDGTFSLDNLSLLVYLLRLDDKLWL